MIFVVLCNERKQKLLLVKATNSDEVEKRLNLKEGESVVGCFTDIEIESLSDSSFAVVSSS